jgi:hypothetical protein
MDGAECKLGGLAPACSSTAVNRGGCGMKPYVICHMNASVDGRILGSRWRPAENRMPGLFEHLHEQLGDGLLAHRPCDRQRIRQGETQSVFTRRNRL